MNEPYSVPSLDKIKDLAYRTPSYMHPNLSPSLVIFEGGLSNNLCDEMIKVAMEEEPYPFPSCEATTRECQRPLHPVFGPLIHFAIETNKLWWNFDLDDIPGAWLQTYEVGDSYKMHTDGFYGQTRKMTAIVLLSDPSEYEGGILRFVAYPEIHESPKTRGTICVFPPWILHEVSAIEDGFRQTINLGFWGPPFR